ncbi:hypothetical protein DIURU_005187 [Diutina rugosa]|uniref:Uncharacterized protein n=1 Tax=Diutina rugosa TaxID=5481 RepID=A0A642UEI3_DIURU|nr:uncharacterized protein DIURU_005187 [Diutina rugosa]KAA8897588.1 hypothetical protein DIURU_005187 [Diutina rugosa]
MAKKNHNKDEPAPKPVTDSRFKAVHNDPRFRLPSSRHMKVKVDERFSKKELEKLNASSRGAKIDRYGRKLKEKNVRDDLKKFYEMSDSEESEDSGSEGDSENDAETDAIDDDAVAAELKRLDKLAEAKEAHSSASEAETSSSSESEGSRDSDLDSDSSESDSDSDSDSDDSDSSAESDLEIEETKPDEGEPTKRFAAVNMDFDNIRAVDLFASFQSFVEAGDIVSVTIYPSQYGKEQMAREEREGPPKDLFKSKKKKKAADSDSDASDVEIDVNDPEALARAAKKLYADAEDKDSGDYDSRALRRYQLQRLRYYYAVVECRSVKAAKTIYSNCDGSEYESTANVFDLRYIPDDMDFDEDEPKDQCFEVPARYKPSSEFVTDALTHSKAKLTWDETPRERLALAQKAFSQKEVEDMDLKAYLASGSDSEDGSDKEAKADANKYKSLLGGFKSKFGKADGANEDEDDVDMEITFNPGLDVAAAEAEAKRVEEESTIAAYKRKEKERRQARLERAKARKAAEKAAAEENADQEDSAVASKGELELLTMDDDADNKHFTMKDVLKAEKAKKGKKKNKRKHGDDDAAQQVVESFKADLDDDRFREVFESHDYAIDPTNTEYKQTSTMKQILEERGKRKKRKHDKTIEGSGKDGKSEVESLVSKLKRKHGKKQ